MTRNIKKWMLRRSRLFRHQRRHHRITRYYKEGMDIELISAITGVSVPVLKKTYLHVTDEDTVRLYERWLNEGRGGFVCPECGYRDGVLKSA